MNEVTTKLEKKSNPLVHLLNHHIAARQGRRRRRNSSLLVLNLFITVSIGVITSYRQLLSSSANKHNNALDNFIEGSGAPLLPPHEDFWEKSMSSCLHVDNICSQNDNWFYAPTNNFNKDTYQPSIRLVLNRTD